MPSKSKKQHNLMAAVANNPQFAERVGIPQSVGEDYIKADEGRKFSGGGMSNCGTKNMQDGGKVRSTLKKTSKRDNQRAVERLFVGPPKPENAFEQTSPSAYRKLNDLKNKQEMLEIRKQDMHKMPDGTMMKDNAMNCGGKVHMAKGGSVRGCGCATKGLTKGRMV